MSTESRELPELLRTFDALATYENRPGHSRLTWAQAAADLRQSLAHSRAQDSGGEAVCHECRLSLTGMCHKCAAKMDREMYDDFVAEQPAKGEGACRCTSSDPWDCIRTDDLAGLPCFCKCHTAAQQSSDPADDDFDVLYAAEPDSKQAIKGICRYWYERGRAVTPPTGSARGSKHHR